jgi:hypothetical protein
MSDVHEVRAREEDLRSAMLAADASASFYLLGRGLRVSYERLRLPVQRSPNQPFHLHC